MSITKTTMKVTYPHAKCVAYWVLHRAHEGTDTFFADMHNECTEAGYVMLTRSANGSYKFEYRIGRRGDVEASSVLRFAADPIPPVRAPEPDLMNRLEYVGFAS